MNISLESDQAFGHGLPCITIFGRFCLHLLYLNKEIGKTLHSAVNSNRKSLAICFVARYGAVNRLVQQILPSSIGGRSFHKVWNSLVAVRRFLNQCLSENRPLGLNDAADNEVAAQWSAVRDVSRQECTNVEDSLGIFFLLPEHIHEEMVEAVNDIARE